MAIKDVKHLQNIPSTVQRLHLDKGIREEAKRSGKESEGMEGVQKKTYEFAAFDKPY